MLTPVTRMSRCLPQKEMFQSLSTSKLSKELLPTTFHSYRSFSSAVAEQDDEQPKKVIPFLLADIGEGIAEVELLQWYVAPGDHVAQFDRICEVQSDKATVEITSRYDGIIESLNGVAGDMIAVGSPLLHIAIAGGKEDSNEAEEGVSEILSNVDDEQDRLHIPSLHSEYDLSGDKKELFFSLCTFENGKGLDDTRSAKARNGL